MEPIWLKHYPHGVPHTLELDPGLSLVDWIETALARWGNRPAFTNMGRTLSFAEVDELTQKFAAYLQAEAGLQQGDRVALMLPNLLQYPIALLGCLRAGMVAVNVNPLYTARELKHQLRDSGAKAIVIFSGSAHVLAEVISETEIEHVVITNVGDLLPAPKRQLVNLYVRYIRRSVRPYHLPMAQSFDQALACAADRYVRPEQMQGSDLAALQYTGGTTGVAKGAMLSHGNLLANVAQLMGDKTLLVIESPYLPTVIEKGRFENISYAHLNHFTTRAIDCMCAPLGIGIGSVDLVDTDGGSFVAYLRKGTVTPDGILDSVTGDDLQRFLVRMQQNGDRIRDALSGFSPNEVVGYGAGAKGPFLVSLYELGPMLHAVVDDNVSFHDQYLAGTGTRIVPSSVLEDDAVKAVLILAPTHADSILASLPAGKTAINII